MAFRTLAPYLPEIDIEVDLTNAPTNPVRVWTSVVGDVRDVAWTRGGRTHELQRSAPGTLSAVFNNRHGWFDSTNSSSPYYPGVKRLRWIRARARWAGVVYARWQGLIESWKQEWPEAGRDAVVSIQATDAFKVLNLFDLRGKSYGSQRTDQRVAAVCTDAQLASTVDTGSSTIVAVGPFDDASFALSHLLDVEETENGLLFAGPDGSIVFQGRHYRILNSANPVGIIGEAAGAIPYRVGELDTSDIDLYNAATVTPSGGTTQVWSDATSITDNYERRITRNLLTSDAPEALYAAQYLVGRYKDPSPRIPRVDLLGARATALWPTILGATNSQRFTWKRAASAHTISMDVFVERISEHVTPAKTWDVSFELSPAVDENGWVLGDAVYGLLGQTTKLVY